MHCRQALRRTALLLAIGGLPLAVAAQPATHVMIAGHPARYDTAGHLLPWISWTQALQREMRFYSKCPTDHGYPGFVTATFLRADCTPDPGRRDTVPAT